MIKKITTLSLMLGVSLTLIACSDTTSDPMASSEMPMTHEAPKTVTLETSMPADENMEVFSASYTSYQADEAEGQKHILFFHAPWCPSCAKWEANLEENMGDLGDNVVIYKTDYDTSNDLKTDYGITQQSTAAFINADGSLAKKEADPSIESMNAFFAN
jgi:thiol-disulfide isomerase/thioredoxin